jgi:hypothetical protein
MRRRTLLTIGIVLLLLLAAGGTLLALLHYEPKWYQESVLPAGEVRTQRSQEFFAEFWDLVGSATSDKEWFASFTDEQINSYLEEGFKHSGLAARMLPEDISDPRILIEPEKFHLAFRYGRGTWSTVVSVTARVWLPPGEPNVAAVELIGFQLGAIPISVQSLLERLSEVGRSNGVEVTWYRAPGTGHPVAILRFQADQGRPTLQILVVKLEQGKITIHGKSLEAVGFNWQDIPGLEGLANLFPAIQAGK